VIRESAFVSPSSTIFPYYRHAAADVFNEPQIVRDEEIRQLQPVLQLHQQPDHLRLNRHVSAETFHPR
jgi:hypothetical protein